jgi:hypothetical protein
MGVLLNKMSYARIAKGASQATARSVCFPYPWLLVFHLAAISNAE